MEQKQIVTDLKPVLAEKIAVSGRLNFRTKDGKEITNKNGKVDLVFLDGPNLQAVVRVVIDPYLLKEMLPTLDKISNELISKIETKAFDKEMINANKEGKKEVLLKQDYIG